MGRVLPLLGLVAYIVLTIEGQNQLARWDSYDCRRPNSQCNRDVGKCITADGTCDCNGKNPPVPGWQGFDCFLESNTIQAGCSISCENGGTCFNDGTTDTCYCGEKYTGQLCEQRRVDVNICNDTHIGIYIKPHHANLFAGQVVVVRDIGLDQEEYIVDAACSKGPENTETTDDSFRFILPLSDPSDPCYAGLTTGNTSDGGTRFQYVLRVLYWGIDYAVDTDERHTFVCVHDSTGNEGGVILTDSAPDLSGAIVEGTHKPVTMTIHGRDGNVLQSPIGMNPVVVGQTLYARLILEPSSTYTSMAVDSCIVYSKADPSIKSITFLENRCPHPNALSIVDATYGAVRANPLDVRVAFFAIKFRTTTDLYVSCNVTLCGSFNTNNCDPADCGPSPAGAGRKKRQAEGDGDIISVSGHLLVVNSAHSLGSVDPSVVKEVVEQSCLQSTAFLVITSVLGVLLIIVLIVAIAVCRRQSKKNKKSPKTFSVYDNPTMTRP